MKAPKTKYKIGQCVIVDNGGDKHKGWINQVSFYKKDGEIKQCYILKSLCYVDDDLEPIGIPNMNILFHFHDEDVIAVVEK